MSKQGPFLGLVVLSSVFAVPAAGLASSASDTETAPVARITGMRVTDLAGSVHRLGIEDEVVPVALVFLDTECPIANKYAPRLNEIARAATQNGTQFFGVVSDPSTSATAAREHRAKYALEFPVLFDASGELAARLVPTTVPEAFVVDTKDRVAYRGRIDDRFVALGKQRASITSHDFADAIAAVASGAAPQDARTEPVGCMFEAWDGASIEESVTYHRDVAPLLAANCVECHRAGDVGPFALDTYDDVRRRAKMIAHVTRTRTMPPWFAADGYGHFRDERTLSRSQIDVLEAWAAAGAPEGDAANVTPPPTFPAQRWRLGEPDLVVEMPVDYEVPAAGEDIYRYFVIPNEFVDDQAVVAIDFRPGDPSVVHHCIAYMDWTGEARRSDDATPAPGFSVFGTQADAPDSKFDASGLDTTSQIAGWAPGTQPYVLPGGVAQRLKGGGDFVLEIHYHLSGTATTDRSALALYFADGPVERYTESLVIGTQNIDIAPGDPEYLRHVWMDVPSDMNVIDVSPHMHNLGRSVEVLATLPDGREEPLIRIDDWDFRWQGAYTYRTPVRLPAGSRIDAFFVFDNSSENVFNPSDPPIRVREGWRTFDEMCLFYFTVVPDEPEQAGGIYRAMFESFQRSGAPD